VSEWIVLSGKKHKDRLDRVKKIKGSKKHVPRGLVSEWVNDRNDK